MPVQEKKKKIDKPTRNNRASWIRLIIAILVLALIIVVGIFNFQASVVLGILGAAFAFLQWQFPVSHHSEESSAAESIRGNHTLLNLSDNANKTPLLTESSTSQPQIILPPKTEHEMFSAVHPVSDTIFHFNEPLTDPQEYFGRVRERTTLINRVGKGASTSVVGPRKIGKTWLLHHLQFIVNSQFRSHMRVCYLDASTPSCKTIAGFIGRVLEELEIFGSLSSQNLTDLEKIVRDFKSRKINPLICIDEFEGFDNKEEFDLIFFKELRALTQIGLCLVVASKKPLIDIVGENGHTSGFFNVFEQLTLKPFNQQEAEAFVGTKSKQAGFTEEEGKNLLLFGQDAGQYYPMRLQLAGKMLLEDKNLAVQEGVHYYRPDDLHYWREFGERLEEKYRGVVR
jgi:hypothetical protein